MERSNRSGAANGTEPDIDRFRNARLRLHLSRQRARDELKALDDVLALPRSEPDDPTDTRAA